MVLPLASALDALRSPRARQANDESVLAELRSAGGVTAGLPPGLELEWLGTAGFRISFEGTHVLVDPYVSRRGVLRTLGRGALLPDPERVERHVPRADAILVGHTHFDHVLDVPRICALHRCKVYGSSSVTNLMAAHGAAGRVVEVVPGRVYPIGPFEVTFVESAHSKLVAGLAIPFEGELTCDHLDELSGARYRCGRVFGIHVRVAGVTFYHQGSAELIDDRVVHRGVDYFLAGISGRGFSRNYVSRILSKLSPRVVVPHHFDDFFRPLGTRMGFSLNVNLGGFVEEVREVSADFQVLALAPLERWTG